MFLAFFFIKSYVKLFQYKDSLIKQINIIGTKNSLKMIVFNVYTFLEKIMALYGSYGYYSSSSMYVNKILLRSL